MHERGRLHHDDLQVFVLGAHRPAGTSDHVTVEADPHRLLELLRAANRGGDVHLGDGMRLTDAVSPDMGLEFASSRALPGGSVEIEYRVRPGD